MWTITSFNPVTHDIEMKHAEGAIISFSIPPEHRLTRHTKLTYIQSKVVSHRLSKQPKTQKSLLHRLLKALHVI